MTTDDCRTSATSEKMARAAYSTFLRILRTINEWLATSLGVEVLPFLLFLTITQHIQTAGTHFHTYNHSPAHRPIDVNATDERAKLDLRWRPPSLGIVAYSFQLLGFLLVYLEFWAGILDYSSSRRSIQHSRIHEWIKLIVSSWTRIYREMYICAIISCAFLIKFRIEDGVYSVWSHFEVGRGG